MSAAHMYGLPNHTDLSFLRGRELQQVCFGRWQVILHFDGAVSISIESLYEIDAQPADRLKMLELIEARVLEASAAGHGAIKIRFADGRTLQILDSKQEFESYRISAPGINIIV